MFRILALCLAVLACDINGIRMFTNVSDYEYSNLPTVFHLDDFDKCMNVKNGTLYCYTTIQLSPKGSSDTWKIIEELIDVPRFYRHDRLRYGICVPETCPEISKAHYALGNGSEELWNGISSCYSLKLASLGVQGNVSEIHCENETLSDIDFVDKLYAIVVIALLMMTVFGTTYDVFTSGPDPSVKEAIPNTSIVRKVLIAFSIVKNFRRLTTVNETEDGKVHEVFQGIRVYNMWLVVMCHTVMVTLKAPVHNTRFVEDFSLDPLNSIVMHGGVACLTFMLISGWLMAYYMTEAFEKKGLTLRHLVTAFIFRILRIWPVLIISIGFSATWLRHIIKSPSNELVNGEEFLNCRKNWLWNLLFINNYYKTGEICLQQTWYISSEVHAFLVGLLLLWLVLKYPQHSLKLFSFFFVATTVASFSYVYYHATQDIVPRAFPENMYTIYLRSEEWKYYYAAGIHYFPAYFQGMMTGYYFYKLRNSNKQRLNPSKIFLLIWYFCIWFFPLSSIIWSIRYYAEGLKHTRLQIATYQVVSRFFFITPINIAILGFALGLGSHMRTVCAWQPLQSLGRVVFSVYLTHVAGIRIRVVTNRFPAYLSYYKLIITTGGDIFASFVIGTIICLLVEMPVSALLNIWLKKTSEKHEEKKSK